MDQWEKEQIIEYIIVCMEEAGYCAEEQLAAYVMSNDTNYITRNGNAREWIKKLDVKWITRYLEVL